MYIELAEYLRCPSDHADVPLVVATGAMKDRAIVFGTLGCPVCKSEYMVVNRVALFGPVADEVPGLPAVRATPHDVHALLALASPGGYVVLLGSAARLATGLAERMDGVHLIAVNAPKDIVPRAFVSVAHARSQIPLRAAMARGVVVGAEHAMDPWLAEAVRVVLPRQRVVILREGIQPPGLKGLASGEGMWVGEKKG